MANKRYTRRDCLKILGLLTAASTFSIVSVEPVFSREFDKLKKVSRTLPLMSTYVTITIYDQSKERAVKAQEMAFSKMKKLIDIFDRFNPNSHISYLNENKTLNDVPPEFSDLLKKSQSIAKLCSEKFDITILPLLETIEEELRVHGKFPQLEEIREILPYVGWENIHISPKKITLSKETKITLDGIAKGYIVDQAAEVISKYGIKHALIDAGGDIRLIGDKDGKQKWTIGIEDPHMEKKYIQTVKLSHLAIATSGNYRNYFDHSKKIFHIIDKDLDLSPQRTISCTVMSKTACLADGLATGFFALSPEKAVKVANELNLPILMVTHGERCLSSNTWEKFKT